MAKRMKALNSASGGDLRASKASHEKTSGSAPSNSQDALPRSSIEAERGGKRTAVAVSSVTPGSQKVVLEGRLFGDATLTLYKSWKRGRKTVVVLNNFTAPSTSSNQYIQVHFL